jgi:hypothetical protein
MLVFEILLFFDPWDKSNLAKRIDFVFLVSIDCKIGEEYKTD